MPQIKFQPEVDFHCHSYYSDGSPSPTEIIRRARRAGIKAITLTDHDNCFGVPEFLMAAAEAGIEAASSIEISTHCRDKELHLLGFGIDYEEVNRDTAPFATIWNMRNGRYHQSLKKLSEYYHAEFDLDKYYSENGKEDFAPYLSPYWTVEYFSREHRVPFKEIDRHCQRGGIAFVPYDYSKIWSPAEAMFFIKQHGGVPILAHPGEWMRKTNATERDMFDLFEGLALGGLKGVEVYTPKHSAFETKFFENITRDFDLIPTAGSDYHGEFTNEWPLGAMGATVETFHRLQEWAGKI